MVANNDTENKSNANGKYARKLNSIFDRQILPLLPTAT